MKNVFKLFVLLTVSLKSYGQCSPGVVVPTNFLYIYNFKNCDVTVNYEVSDCQPSPQFCSSIAQFGSSSGKFVIAAGGVFSVDISSIISGPAGTSLDCTFYGNPTPGTYDVNVNLFEIAGVPLVPAFVYGRVSNGCPAPASNCFNSTQTDSGTNGPISCDGGNWKMVWLYPGGAVPAAGVTVNIN